MRLSNEKPFVMRFVVHLQWNKMIPTMLSMITFLHADSSSFKTSMPELYARVSPHCTSGRRNDFIQEIS